MVNSNLRPGKWYKLTDDKTKAGALANSFEDPRDITIAIRQQSERWLRDNLDRSESTHRAISYQKGLKAGDEIEQDGHRYKVEYANDDARLAILGLIQIELNR